MSDNGRIPIIGAQHRTVADMSSRDRSALMDETLMTVHELLLQVATLAKQVSESQRAMLALHKAQDADSGRIAELESREALRRTIETQRGNGLFARLRRLVMGL